MLAAKLALTLLLVGVIACSAWGRAPRHAVSATELRRLIGATLILYLVGVAAVVVHRGMLATFAFAVGVVAAAFAGWLSRGSDSEDPPADDDGDGPPSRRPPPEPDGFPAPDWAWFDRERRAWEQSGTPTRR